MTRQREEPVASSPASRRGSLRQEPSVSPTKVATIRMKAATELHDWIIKPLPDRRGLCVEGQKRDQEDFWHSTAICDTAGPHVVITVTGSVYMLKGRINKLCTINNGFSREVAQSFSKGFPKNWKQVIEDFYKQLEESITVDAECSPMKNKKVARFRSVSKKAPASTYKKVEELDCSLSSPSVWTPFGVVGKEISRSDVTVTRSGRMSLPPLAGWTGQQYSQVPGTDTIQVVCGTDFAEKCFTELATGILQLPKKTARMVCSNKLSESLIQLKDSARNNKTNKNKRFEFHHHHQTVTSSQTSMTGSTIFDQRQTSETFAGSGQMLLDQSNCSDGKKEAAATFEMQYRELQMSVTYGSVENRVHGDEHDDEVIIRRRRATRTARKHTDNPASVTSSMCNSIHYNTSLVNAGSVDDGGGGSVSSHIAGPAQDYKSVVADVRSADLRSFMEDLRAAGPGSVMEEIRSGGCRSVMEEIRSGGCRSVVEEIRSGGRRSVMETGKSEDLKSVVETRKKWSRMKKAPLANSVQHSTRLSEVLSDLAGHDDDDRKFVELIHCPAVSSGGCNGRLGKSGNRCVGAPEEDVVRTDQSTSANRVSTLLNEVTVCAAGNQSQLTRGMKRKRNGLIVEERRDGGAGARKKRKLVRGENTGGRNSSVSEQEDSGSIGKGRKMVKKNTGGRNSSVSEHESDRSIGKGRKMMRKRSGGRNSSVSEHESDKGIGKGRKMVKKRSGDRNSSVSEQEDSGGIGKGRKRVKKNTGGRNSSMSEHESDRSIGKGRKMVKKNAGGRNSSVSEHESDKGIGKAKKGRKMVKKNTGDRNSSVSQQEGNGSIGKGRNIMKKNTGDRNSSMSEQEGNGGIGRVRSIARKNSRSEEKDVGDKRKSSKGRKLDENSADRNSSWSEKEKSLLWRALQAVDAADMTYWEKVCQVVGSRSRSECQHFYKQHLEHNLSKKHARQISCTSPQHRNNKSGRQKGEPIRGGKGTLKRKQDLRDFLDEQNHGYEDNLFDSTPFVKRRAGPSVAFTTSMDKNDSEIFGANHNFFTPVPGTSAISTPGTALRVKMASTKKTPPCDSHHLAQVDDNTPVSINRRKADQYIRAFNERKKKAVPVEMDHHVLETCSLPVKSLFTSDILPSIVVDKLADGQDSNDEEEEEDNPYMYNWNDGL